MSISFDPATGSAGVPTLVLATSYTLGDVTKDGQWFLAIKTPLETAPRRVNVVLNCLKEIDAKAR